MIQWCTKFRAFYVLLVLCVINALVFRSYFGTGLRTLLLINGNLTQPPPRTSSTVTPVMTRALVVTSNPLASSASTVSVVTERLDSAGGAGRPMEAWGQVVKPRANVTAPWSRDNTSTLCPLVPPNLGESEWTARR